MSWVEELFYGSGSALGISQPSAMEQALRNNIAGMQSYNPQAANYYSPDGLMNIAGVLPASINHITKTKNYFNDLGLIDTEIRKATTRACFALLKEKK